MSQVKIRIGASLDANATAVFQPLIKASERARAAIQGNLNAALKSGGGAKGSGGVRHNVDALDRELDKMANDILRKEERAQKRRTAAVSEGTRDRVRIEKEAAKEIAAAEGAPARQRRGGFWSGAGGAIGVGRRAGMRVPRGVAMAYVYGGAAASTFAHGIGINTDVSSMISQGVDNEALAQKIINSDPNAKGMSVASRHSAAASLLGSAQQVSNATATDTGETLEALEAFVAKTGDLQTAKDSIQGLATLSKATGTNLADMANAAAEVSNNLADGADKGKTVYDVMRAVAGEGQLGAVEIKDLATQMAKIAGQAGSFEGDKAQNIAMLGAMAQEAKLKGTATSATQAATTVGAFVANLTKGATLKNWTKAGLNPYADKAQTKLRSPEELILEALKHTKGSLPGLQKLFGSAQSVRAVKGFATIYSEAGGGQAGLEAVDAEFKRFSVAVMTQDDVMRAFGAQMDTTKSKVQIFNNELQQTVEKLATAVTPAFEELAPLAIALAGSFSSLMDSDFMKTVLHGGDQAERSTQLADFGSQVGADNYTSKVNAFRLGLMGGVTKGLGPGPWAEGQGMGPVDTDAEMAAAKPIFEGGAREQDELAKQVAASDEQLKKDRSNFHLYHKDLGTDDATIGANAKLGDREGMKYVADKAANERLHQSQTTLAQALDGLKNAILNGKIMVTLAPGAPPPPGHTPGGAAPSGSPPPPG